MAFLKTSAYGFPTRPPRSGRGRTEIFRPTRGIFSGEPWKDLPAGFASDSKNFVVEGDFLLPRPGLFPDNNFTVNQPVLGATEAFDIQGSISGVAASEDALLFRHPSNNSWSILSYVKGSFLGVDDALSGLSSDYWSLSPVYDALTDKNILVASNGTNWTKWFAVEDSTTTFSDLTWLESLASTKGSKTVAAINDRLVFFNTFDTTGTKFPTRVLWSARGQPKSFLIADGAGFEDLMAMRGEGLAAVRHSDFLLLFTDQEIWVAQPTLDDYAFRFSKVSDKVSCPYPQTIASTPLGVVFLGRDLEVYVTDGYRIEPLGPPAPGEPSRIQTLLRDELTKADRAWGVFNQVGRRYELYYATQASTSGFANKALFYHLDSRSWLPQAFSHELSYGFDLDAVEAQGSVTWGEMGTYVWSQVQQLWGNSEAQAAARYVNVFSSTGSAYQLRSDQTTDSGATIDARWRSHGLRQRDAMGKVNLTEVWIDYEADSASSLSVFAGSGLSGDFGQGIEVSLTTSSSQVLAPTWVNAQAPVFEVRVADGGRPKIARFQATLREGGRF